MTADDLDARMSVDDRLEHMRAASAELQQRATALLAATCERPPHEGQHFCALSAARDRYTDACVMLDLQVVAYLAAFDAEEEPPGCSCGEEP